MHDLWDFLLPLLIAASAVHFAIFVGRAQASQMRDLREGLLSGVILAGQYQQPVGLAKRTALRNNGGSVASD